MSVVTAPGGAVIGPFTNGSIYDLIKKLSVRANPVSNVMSVVFTLDGAVIRTENVRPYAAGGDINAVYNIWRPAVGSHTLVATPYSATHATGTAGEAVAVTFTVVNTTATPSPTPTPSPTAAATATPTPAPTPAPTPTATATPIPSPPDPATSPATPTQSPTPIVIASSTPTPTPTLKDLHGKEHNPHSSPSPTKTSSDLTINPESAPTIQAGVPTQSAQTQSVRYKRRLQRLRISTSKAPNQSDVTDPPAVPAAESNRQ